MTSLRKAFRDDLYEVLKEAITGDIAICDIADQAADRLIELARRVINEE